MQYSLTIKGLDTMKTKDIQIRGNCQCCGKVQAVVGGLMSKHGYTVENGWFSGVCSGRNFQPMQFSRAETDSIVLSIRQEIPKLLAQAEQVEAGLLLPKTVTRRTYNAVARQRVTVEVPYSEATPSEQSDERNRLAWSLKHRASSGKSFADQLEAIADKVHGTALIEVAKKEVEQIRIGDKKTSKETNLIYTCFKVEGVRVWWTATKQSGQQIKSWMGSQAWRKLEAI